MAYIIYILGIVLFIITITYYFIDIPHLLYLGLILLTIIHFSLFRYYSITKKDLIKDNLINKKSDIRNIPKVIREPKKFFLDQLKYWKMNEKYKDSIYGLHWGDPDKNPVHIYVRKRFITPYINSNSVALEIGPGGGRWTKYLLEFKKLYVIDPYQEILDELKKNYNKKNMVFIKNNGTDFPRIPKKSIDFLFTYACFVHLEVKTIDKYLKNILKIINNNSKICIQYSDNDKELGRNKSFTKNNPRIMRKLIIDNGYEIIDEYAESLKNSSIILFKIKNKKL